MHKIIAIIVILSMLGAAAWFIFEAGADSIRAGTAETVRLAVKKARETEKKKQEKVNATIQKQYDEQAAISARLSSDLVRLRNRPSRRYLPDNSRAACKGATGAELSRSDSDFLVREAARADKLRTALKACYNYADSIIQEN